MWASCLIVLKVPGTKKQIVPFVLGGGGGQGGPLWSMDYLIEFFRFIYETEIYWT